MEFLKMVDGFEVIVIDNDGTLHKCEEYLEAGRQAEVRYIAMRIGSGTVDAAKQSIVSRREQLGKNGKIATMTEAVLSFGITIDEWNRAREHCYDPELFLKKDETMVSAVESLLSRYKVVIASNNPRGVTRRALVQMGFERLFGRLSIVGPEDVGTGKADPSYFLRTANLLGVGTEKCITVGDRREADGDPAIAAGMGSILVSSPEVTRRVFGMLLHYQKQFDGMDFLRQASSEISIYGITGRAGAGKTTLARKLIDIGAGLGMDTEYLSLDVFFKKSSCERKAWLEEVKGINADEYARRADQMCWWDFCRCEEAILRLRAGQTLHLEGVYNRADGGELSGIVHIEPREGLRVVIEGVAIAHLSRLFDDLGMLHVPAFIRKMRLSQRDAYRKGCEIEERFRITESFENAYFADYAKLATTHIDNTNGVPVVVGGIPIYMD